MGFAVRTTVGVAVERTALVGNGSGVGVASRGAVLFGTVVGRGAAGLAEAVAGGVVADGVAVTVADWAICVAPRGWPASRPRLVMPV